MVVVGGGSDGDSGGGTGVNGGGNDVGKGGSGGNSGVVVLVGVVLEMLMNNQSIKLDLARTSYS